MLAIPIVCLALTFPSDDLHPAVTVPEKTDAHQKLLAWQEAAKNERIECRHVRYVYDATFSTAKVAVGRIVVDRKLGTLIEVNPTDQRPSELPKDSSGKEYRLVPNAAAVWICTPDELLECYPAEKTATRYSLLYGNTGAMEEPLQGANFVSGVIDRIAGGFVADEELIALCINAAELRVKMKRGFTFLDGETSGNVATNISRIQVAFQEGSPFPHSIQLHHPGERARTVYVFEDVQIGESNPDQDPTQFDLTEYKVNEIR